MPTFCFDALCAALLKFRRFRCRRIRRLQHHAERRRPAGRGAAAGLADRPVNIDTTPLVVYAATRPRNGRNKLCPAHSLRLFRGRHRAGRPRRGSVQRPHRHTLYLGGGGPADPDRTPGVAMVGGHTISVRADSTYSNCATRPCRSRPCRGGCRRWRWPSPTG